MGRIYERGGKLWLDFTDLDGERRRRSSGLPVGEEAAAAKQLADVEARVEAHRTATAPARRRWSTIMARMKGRDRVLGPYPHRNAWELVIVSDGKRMKRLFPTREKALAIKAELEPLLAMADAERGYPWPTWLEQPIEWFDAPAHVYFVGMREMARIKIGWSSSPDRRLRGFSTALPARPVLLGLEPDDLARSRERQLHDRFAHLRSNGEWFRIDGELLEHIAASRR